MELSTLEDVSKDFLDFFEDLFFFIFLSCDDGFDDGMEDRTVGLLMSDKLWRTDFS